MTEVNYKELAIEIEKFLEVKKNKMNKIVSLGASKELLVNEVASLMAMINQMAYIIGKFEVEERMVSILETVEELLETKGKTDER
jgi:hypothetical protein